MGTWDVNLRSGLSLSDGEVEELKAVQTDYYNYLLVTGWLPISSIGTGPP